MDGCLIVTEAGPRCSNPECGEVGREGDRFCEACGHELWMAGSAPPAAAPASNGLLHGQSRRGDSVESWLPGVGGVSHPGLVRPSNEDAMALASVDAREAAVAVVCDGVSASQRADAAARAAAAAALSSLVAAVDGGRFDPVMAMRRAVAKAQAAVCAIPHSGADREPPATTLVAAVLGAGAVTVGWVGDSRAYLVGEGGSTLLTRDDTWAAEQVAHGLASEEEAAADPRKHTLTRWLGADWLEHQDPWVISFNVEPPGRIVLCSDGLSNYLPTPARLGEVLAEAPQATALEAARRLTEFACRAGGHDNVTVVVADVGSAWRPVVP